MARKHSAPAAASVSGTAEPAHSATQASSALLMLGGAAAGCGTWLGAYTDSISIGEDSRFIALGLTAIVSLLVGLSPAISSLKLLVNTYQQTPATQQHSSTTPCDANGQPGSSTVPAPATGDKKVNTTLPPKTTKSKKASSEPEPSAAASALKPSHRTVTFNDVYRKKRQQLAGLVLLMMVVWAVFGMIGPSGVITLACFTVAVATLRAATAKP